MKASALAQALPLYIPMEGNKSQMYRDCKGLVSIGIGCRLSLEDALKLPFYNPSKQCGADETEIKTDYNSVKDNKIVVGQLILDPNSINELAIKRILMFDGYARNKWPSTYDIFPADAQLAINSYLFATGHLDTSSEPRLCAAIDDQNWWRASAECHMSDESKGNPGLKPRNDANRRMFANAARTGFPDCNPDSMYLNYDAPGVFGPHKHYFFTRGGGWARYDWNRDEFDKGPIDNLDEWLIPRDFAAGVTAVFSGGCNGMCDQRNLPHTGKTYFINGSTFLAYDWKTNDLDSQVPRPLSELLHDRENEAVFTRRLDAVVRGRGDWQNKLFLFSGSTYAGFDLDTNVIDWGPADVKSEFKLPDGFENGIDAALNGEGPYRDFLYLFKGEYYVKFSWKVTSGKWAPVKGYVENNRPVVKIGDGWTNFNILNASSIIGATNAGISC
jgi:GH24 family phage-related lysozyme (muramidase)